MKVNTSNPHIETHEGFMGSHIQIQRSNTQIDGYIPVVREIEGALFLVQGAHNVFIGVLAPTTNEPAFLKGKAQLKDAAINLTQSPIMGAIGAVAAYTLFSMWK